MTDREKLIGLLYESDFTCNQSLCEECDYLCSNKCKASMMADHLLANGVTFQDWIPVSERLPWEDIRVLVWLRRHDYGPIRIDTDRVHNNRWVRWNGCVTHWMPLPEPPKEDN